MQALSNKATLSSVYENTQLHEEVIAQWMLLLPTGDAGEVEVLSYCLHVTHSQSPLCILLFVKVNYFIG